MHDTRLKSVLPSLVSYLEANEASREDLKERHVNMMYVVDISALLAGLCIKSST